MKSGWAGLFAFTFLFVSLAYAQNEEGRRIVDESFDNYQVESFGDPPGQYGWVSVMGSRDPWVTSNKFGVVSPKLDELGLWTSYGKPTLAQKMGVETESFGGKVDFYENFLLTGPRELKESKISAEVLALDNDAFGLVSRYTSPDSYFACFVTNDKYASCDGGAPEVKKGESLFAIIRLRSDQPCDHEDLKYKDHQVSKRHDVFFRQESTGKVRARYRMEFEIRDGFARCTLHEQEMRDGNLILVGDPFVLEYEIEEGDPAEGMVGLLSWDNGAADGRVSTSSKHKNEAGWNLFFDNFTADSFDPDTDGDGLSNDTEARLAGADPNNEDINNNGIPDGLDVRFPSSPLDTDNDGIADWLDSDTDGDGVPDIYEQPDPLSPQARPEGQNLPDYLNKERKPEVTDSNQDGIPDVVWIAILKRLNLDTECWKDPSGDCDKDNISNIDEFFGDRYTVKPEDVFERPPMDTDLDGIPDLLDDDSDNDGTKDIDEAGDQDLETPAQKTIDLTLPDYRFHMVDYSEALTEQDSNHDSSTSETLNLEPADSDNQDQAKIEDSKRSPAETNTDETAIEPSTTASGPEKRPIWRESKKDTGPKAPPMRRSRAQNFEPSAEAPPAKEDNNGANQGTESTPESQVATTEPPPEPELEGEKEENPSANKSNGDDQSLDPKPSESEKSDEDLGENTTTDSENSEEKVDQNTLGDSKESKRKSASRRLNILAGNKNQLNSDQNDSSNDSLLQGSGCQSSSSSAILLFLMLFSSIALLKSRFRKGFFIFGLALVFVSSPNGKAQTNINSTLSSSNNLNVQLFRPAALCVDGVVMHSACIRKAGQWYGSVFYNYVVDPIEITSSNGPVFNLLRAVSTFDLTLGTSITKNLAFDLSLPVHHVVNAFNQVSNADGVVIGDLRARMYFQAQSNTSSTGEDQLGITFIPYLGFPTHGERSDYLGDGSMVGGAKLALDHWLGDYNHLRLMTGIGIRNEVEELNLDIATEFLYAAGYTLVLSKSDRMNFFAEVFGSTPINQDMFLQRSSPVELIGGVQKAWTARPSWALTAGVGRGLNKGYGAPEFRFFAGLTMGLEGKQVKPNSSVKQSEEKPEEISPVPVVQETPAEAVVVAPAVSEKPQTKLLLTVASKDQSELEPWIQVRDRDGKLVFDSKTTKAKLDLDEGEYVVHIRAPDFLPQKRSLTIEEGQWLKSEVTLARVEVGEKILILDKILFEFDSAKLQGISLPILDHVHQVMNENPDILKLQIEAHTDDKGSDAYNLNLSQRRAESAMQYLINKGLSKKRLEPKGYGETKPLANNASEEGRAANRRVEFTILEVESREVLPKVNTESE